jgi:hypothetical protein
VTPIFNCSALRTDRHIVTPRIATTAPSDTSTGTLNTSISSILLPMKTRITASP